MRNNVSKSPILTLTKRINKNEKQKSLLQQASGYQTEWAERKGFDSLKAEDSIGNYSK